MKPRIKKKIYLPSFNLLDINFKYQCVVENVELTSTFLLYRLQRFSPSPSPNFK